MGIMKDYERTGPMSVEYAPREALQKTIERAHKAEAEAYRLRWQMKALEMGNLSKPALMQSVRAEEAESELKALKLADARRTIALTNALALATLFAEVAYDTSRLGDDYTDTTVRKARELLEATDDC